jgi:glutamyl-Q tRNA(Asp) synthetase
LVRERQVRGDPYALRLDVAKAQARTGRLTFVDEREGTVEARPETLGDVVLARRDAPASYHLCVTVDDHLQGVTLVTRGVDLFHATHIHRLLQAILDLNVPTYLHHLLLTNAAGERLSKRDGAVAIRTLRQAGRSAAEVRALAGFSD